MKILLVYSTKYGSTKKCAELIANEISCEHKIMSVSQAKSKIKDFETIIIGGSVYMGKIRKDITHFCKHNMSILLQKKLILFTCCYTAKETEGFFASIFDEQLIDHATYVTAVGGELNYHNMNYVYRKMFELLNKIEGFREGFREPSIDLEELKVIAKIAEESNFK